MESLICVLHNLPELNELNEPSPVQGSSGLARVRAWESQLALPSLVWLISLLRGVFKKDLVETTTSGAEGLVYLKKIESKTDSAAACAIQH
jgi:hypothetical protein